MKAIILAAGFGSRLKPWTDMHPKALVPVGGVPMLERVLVRLKSEGYDEVVVNIHHFASQIEDFIGNLKIELDIKLSDESNEILDTGGGVLKALSKFKEKDGVLLVHNVDILSDAPLGSLMEMHIKSGNDISLVTSDRESSRKLIFNEYGQLRGWHNESTDEYLPAGLVINKNLHESAFSGIYLMNINVGRNLEEYSLNIGSKVFPIMNFFIDSIKKVNIGEIKIQNLNLIDIGKPATLNQANEIFKKIVL